MADLGNLFFSLGLKTDDIDAAWNKALEKYKKEAKIVLKLDTKEVTAAQQQTKMDIESSKRKVLVKKEEQQIEREINKTRQANLLLEEKIRTQAARTQSVRERSAGAINRANTALSTQHRLMQNLHTMAASYISIFAAARLVRSLATITGEFETQRIALRAILQDLQGADAIFNQIKQLAVKSPFQFKDLVTYTKQLSAFSIPMNELYDTTKMLADVSAGLGVGMDRLVLAYGQIRAASVLRGQEVRQLTEAGIPVIEELRKKFEALGETGITAADVFDKISARLVPFEMIKEMFTDMTSEGGKFFNMQEVLAESLTGKMSNLKDAYQIMMAKIGESDGGIMKTAVDTARALIENYETIGRVLTVLVATYGVYQAGLLVTAVANGTLMTSNGLLVASIVGVRNAITALNIAIATNPYLALALAVTTIVGSMWALRDSSTAAEKAQAKLAKTMESLAERRSKMSTDVSSLIGTITSETTSVYEQVKAWDELIRRYDFFSKYSIDKLRSMSENERKSIIASFLQQDDKESLEILYDNKKKEVDALAKLYDKQSSIAMDIAGSVLGIEFPVTSGDIFAQQYADAWRIANQELKGIEQQLQKVNELERQAEFQQKPEAERIAIYNARLRELKRQKELAEKEAPEGKGKDRLLESLKKNISDTQSELSKFRQSEVVKNKEFWEEQKKTAEGVISGFSSETLKLMRAGRFGDVKPELAGAYKKAIAEIAEADKMLGIYDFEGKKKEKASTDAVRALEKLLNERDNYRIKKETDTQNALIDEEIRGSKEKARVIESTYKKEIFAAELFKKERIKLVNEANGLTTKDKGYVSELSDIDLEEYTNLINNANEKRSRSTIKLEQDTASEITKIWKEATEQTLSNYDREKEAIIEKYRLLIERARDAAAEESFIYDIKKKEYDALISLDISYGLALINQEEDVKKKLSETSKKYFDEQLELRRQQLQVEIDAASERVAMLQAEEAITGKDNSREIQKWTEFIVMASKQQKQLKDNYFVIGEMLGGVLSQSSDEFVQKIGGIITTLSSALGSLQKAYGKDGTSLDKASSIVGLIMAANSMIKQAREESANPELSKQIRITKEISNRLGFERSINDLLRERQEIADRDIFGIEDSLDRIIKATQRISELSSGKEGILSSFINNAIFSAEGTGQRRFMGSKTGTYDFTLAEILNGIVPKGGNKPILGVNEVVDYKGQGGFGNFLSVLADPSDILQGRYADANARKDAFLNLQKTVQDALKAMGKSVSDFANMSADDLLTFFELMESAGTITDEGTKKLLDAAKAQVEDVKKAVDDMKQAFSDIVGELGSSLSDLLVDAFTNGNVYGAIDAFHNKIGDVISDIVEQMVFAATLKPFLKKAEVAFMASYGMKPDGSPLDNLNALKPDGTPIVDNTIIDDLDTLGKDIAGGIGAYEKALREADEKLKGMGYKGITGSGTTSSSLGGSIQAAQMTENTANLIGSYINAIRADGARRTMFVEKLVPVIGGINDTMANGLTHLAAINANTFRSANNSGEILDKLNALTTPNSTTRLNATIKTS